jgi:tetratricopeptide (TPR) repeat protein
MITRSTSSLLRHPGRAFILVCVFLLAGYSAYFGGRAALADAMTLKVRRDMGQWREGRNLPPDLSLWRESRNTLMAALEYAPDNPQFYEDLAFLYGLRALAARNNPELEREFLSQVLEYYKQAVSLRPMSPHTWANIALAKHYRGDKDSELWSAFDLAMTYGKNEPAVQITLAEIGRARWGELSEARRTALNAAFARAIPSLRKALETVAARYPHD